MLKNRKGMYKVKEYKMTDEACETIDRRRLEKLDPETSSMVRSEFLTGFSLAFVYLAFVFFIPIVNWYNPEWAFSKMWGGMTYSWFLTAIVAMVMAFVIAYVHTKLYERWERKAHKVKTTVPVQKQLTKEARLDDPNIT